MAKEFKTKEIKGAQTVADKLKAARKKMELSLDDAERDTKIRLKYLEAFETNRYDLLPSEVYALGFLRRYAEYLKLDALKICDLYKIEWQAYISRGGKNQFAEFAPAKVGSELNFSITPKTIAVIAVIAMIVGLFGYIWWAVRKFSAPPKLVIFEPKSEMVITGNAVTIKGQTDVGSFVVINNEAVNVGSDGKFSEEVNVGTNINTIEIVARNRLNSKTIHTIKIVNETDSGGE